MEDFPILVVEDHAINSDVAVLQLKALGYNTETAKDGAEALAAVKKSRYSLILMDVMMPTMDGWEAAKQIRAYEEAVGRRTPIIAVSAWSATDNKTRCLEAGMDDYLDKPYTRASLGAMIKRWLGKESHFVLQQRQSDK